MSLLGDAFKKVFGSPEPPQPSALFGKKSEEEADEIIEIVNDPEGDEWSSFFPNTNPALGPDTPGEIDALPQQKERGGFLDQLFGR
ncbi:MAG TPA: hypothetical protein VFB60_27405 [Ktedonobacteraceae bacterium]|nr:hypothetical protein [Ktedonobacteraceae bacterium]